MLCFFVSDLHGQPHRYRTLFERIRIEAPDAVFFGGDNLPAVSSAWKKLDPTFNDFTSDVLHRNCSDLKNLMSLNYPRVFFIPGNDDPRDAVDSGIANPVPGLWEYIHQAVSSVGSVPVFGYGCVPPTPFRLKDWERYDVSRYVDPGSYPPEEGVHTSTASTEEIRRTTIGEDLEALTRGHSLDDAIMLFHSPPYRTLLDRAALDGRMIDHVPLDVHVGSIAIRRLIESRQPRITLHGHIHESARLTGSWKDRIGHTHLFSAAHDGKELALVRFDARDPSSATRELL